MTIDEVRATIQRLARGVAPAELFAAAVRDEVTVPARKLGPPVPLRERYADGDSLLAAVIAGTDDATGAALCALAALGHDRVTDLALALVADGPGELERAAYFALAHSTRDAALEALLGALAPRGRIPQKPLERSVHPAATARIREVLVSTGLTVFELRPRPLRDPWYAMSADERRALAARDPSGPPTAELFIAQNAVRALAARGDLGSLELIIALFEGHPDDRLRPACAHALAAYRDPRAYEVIDRRRDDVDSTISTICVRASVLRDITTAWERFARHIEPVIAGTASGTDVAAVSTLLYVVHGGTWPRKVPADQDPLLVEPRFLELAAQLRHDDDLGESARMLLEIAPRERVFAVIEKYPRTVASVAPVPLPARRDFLARYEAGEHAVWDELVSNAAAIAQHSELRAEADAVARALMKRVLHNRDVVRATLTTAGARLASEHAPAADADLARLIGHVGPLPVALDAFWRVVGSLQLIPGGKDRYDYGTCALEHEGISLLALDPIEIDGPDVGWQLDEYEERLAESHPEIVGPLALSFAPDYLHKQNISGGPAYAITLPPRTLADAVDPFVENELHQARLVGYLRACFAYGGFPLLEVAALPVDDIGLNERIAFAKVKGAWGPPAERLRAALCRDLIAF